MIGFLHSFLMVFSKLIETYKEYSLRKQHTFENIKRDKANAYDKLQKAIIARRMSNDENADSELMSDDGYKRKQ